MSLALKTLRDMLAKTEKDIQSATKQRDFYTRQADKEEARLVNLTALKADLLVIIDSQVPDTDAPKVRFPDAAELAEARRQIAVYREALQQIKASLEDQQNPRKYTHEHPEGLTSELWGAMDEDEWRRL